MTYNLGLDEALISIRRTSIKDPLEVYYQIDECYACPLEQLETPNWASNGKNISIASHPQDQSFVIGTKYDLSLELRDSRRRASCRLDKLSLANQAHYRIDVAPKNASIDLINPSSQLECTLQTIERGDCYLCPIAILVCIIFSFTAIEKLYAKFWASRGSSHDQTLPSEKTDTESNGQRDHLEGAAVEIRSSEATTKLSDSNAISSEPEGQTETTAKTQSKSEIIVVDEAHRPESKHPKRPRIQSLDTFRGLTIAGMIFVNYGGAGYIFLEHKPWDGITVADFVFPFFVFSMGASIALSTQAQTKLQQSLGKLMLKILRRSTILMLLGLSLNSKWLEGKNLNHLRLTGVLQRFAISYMVVASMYTIELIVGKKISERRSHARVSFLVSAFAFFLEALTALVHLAIYVYMTLYFEYDANCPVGYTGPGGQTENGQYMNCTGGAAAWLDRQVLGDGHMYQDRGLKRIFKAKLSHDPEGMLGYTTSIVLTLAGLQCGKLLFDSNDVSRGSTGSRHHKLKLMRLIQWFVILSAASSCAIAIPVNKRLWSASFIMVTGACAYFAMIVLYILVDIYRLQREMFLIRILNSAGKNAIFLYVGHSLLSDMLPWYFEVDQASHLQLLLRLVWSTSIWLLGAHYMALKGLFIKI